MTWHCPTCQGPHPHWALRCPLDGRLRFAPTRARADGRRIAAQMSLTEPRAGEQVILGEAIGSGPDEHERGMWRPARLALAISTLWLAGPVGWAVFQRPSIARQLLIMLAMVALPLLIAYLFALRVRPGTLPPPVLIERLLHKPAQGLYDALPLDGRLRVGVLTLRPGLGDVVEVRVRDPSTWPPPAAPAMLRLVGTWIAEPGSFRARRIEALTLDGKHAREVVNDSEPLGWLWALAILAGPAALTFSWLLQVLPLRG